MSDPGEQTEPVQTSASLEKKPKKMSTSVKCFLGMGLGLVLGILIGPYASWFDLPSSVSCNS